MKIRRLPDRSGSCLIKIRQLPDRSGSHHGKIRQLPDWSGSCQIEIRQLPDRSGPRFVRSLPESLTLYNWLPTGALTPSLWQVPGNNLWRPAVTDRTCWATVLSEGTKSTVTTQRVRVSQRKYCTAQHCCSDSIKYHSYYTTASTTPTKLQPATPSTTPGDNNPPTCQTVTGQWSLASVSLLCSAVSQVVTDTMGPHQT